MNDKLNFDTVDILAAAIGAVIAFSILPIPADRGTERIVVGLSVLVCVTLKRFFVPTLEPNPESSLMLRMFYLLIGISGSAIVVLVILDRLLVLGIFHDTSFRNYTLVSGVILISLSIFIDRRFLKIKS